MNNKHRKALQELFTDPINGGMEWGRIEALLTGLGCRVHAAALKAAAPATMPGLSIIGMPCAA